MVKLLAAILGVTLLATTVSPARGDWRGRGEEWRHGRGEWRHEREEWHEHRHDLHGRWGFGLGGVPLGPGLPYVSPPPVYYPPLPPPTYYYGPRCGFPYC
jgi:hypothetical protein